MRRPPVRRELEGLKAYQPESGQASILLDANENPWAPPAAFLEKAQALLGQLAYNRYPDPGAVALRKAAAARYRVGAENVVAGNGSDELIQLLLAAFGGEGASLLVPEPTFSMYALCALAQGWKVEKKGLQADFSLGGDFVEAARQARPRMIILASPNNPTGNAFDPAAIDALLQLDGCLVVVDEAYAEFGGQSFASRLAQHDNLVVLRTLSKAYGLAGLRVGFALAQASLVDELEKIRLPYNVNAASQALGTLALQMDAQFEPVRAKILEQKERLGQGLREAGFEVFASDANFYLARHPRAAEIKQALLKASIRVRGFSGGVLENCLRVNAGTEEETTALLEQLQLFGK